jgi:hypothetical protein
MVYGHPQTFQRIRKVLIARFILDFRERIGNGIPGISLRSLVKLYFGVFATVSITIFRQFLNYNQ